MIRCFSLVTFRRFALALSLVIVWREGIRGALPAAARAAPPLNLTAVSFVNVSHGWVAGQQGNATHVLRTTNGGASWLNTTIDASITSLHFVDPSHGWAVGTTPACNGGRQSPRCRSVLFGTSDGGRRWTVRLTAPAGFRFTVLAAPDPQHIWIVDVLPGNCGKCTGHLWHSANGGQSWVKSAADSPITALQFITPTDGWMARNDFPACGASILVSHDGGRHWQRQLHVGGQCTILLDSVSRRAAWALTTFSPARCAMGGCDSYTLYRTSDAGAHWTAEQRPSPLYPWWGGSGFPARIAFVAPSTGWIAFTPGAAAYGGGVLITRDGGRSWTRRLSQIGIPDTSLVTAREGWAIGCTTQSTCSALLHTTTAGSTWRTVHPRA
ncbi:MAG TPA: hypothetical protein VF221_09030 [Chloroflexota bacterium]